MAPVSIRAGGDLVQHVRLHELFYNTNYIQK
jgi:hypothetical protein